MLTSNRDIMKAARAQLTGRYTQPAITTLIYLLISTLIGSIKRIGGVIMLLIGGPLWAGYCGFFLRFTRGQDARPSQLFDGFSNFLNTMVAYLLVALFTLLWSLLLIVPGIVAALSYSQTFFILADDPALEGPEAIRRSKAMMYGHRLRLLGLCARFIGWFLLCIITLGIATIWVGPYFMVSLTRFYEELRQRSAERDGQPASPVQA